MKFSEMSIKLMDNFQPENYPKKKKKKKKCMFVYFFKKVHLSIFVLFSI